MVGVTWDFAIFFPLILSAVLCASCSVLNNHENEDLPSSHRWGIWIT